MKHMKSLKMIAVIAAMLIALICPAAKTEVHAATQITVTGTVKPGTTENLIYLEMSDGSGIMELKLDANTDTSKCKVLVPGKKITAVIYYGNDEYMHASSIASGSVSGGVTVDTANPATVSGKVGKDTTDTLMFLEMSNGTMELKIDPTTDMSACSVMVAGKNVTVVCARGSDAYMHALSISTGAGSTGSYGSTAVADAAPSGTTAVSGKVNKDTNGNVLYLDIDGGTMYIALDANTDTTGGFVATPGAKMTAYVYRGSDATMHAAKITASRAASTTLSGSTTTFSGTVASNSTESDLYLNTSGGVMKIKLDASSTLTGAKILTNGKNITVSASVGADEYWHAVSISTK